MSRSTPALAILRVRSANTPGRSSTSTTTTSRSRVTARCEIASACLAAPARGTKMWSSARSPVPMHVAAAMFTPASLIAAAARASAPGVFSMSMARSTALCPVRLTPTDRDVHDSGRSFIAGERLGLEPSAFLAIVEDMGDAHCGGNRLYPALHQLEVRVVAQAEAVQPLGLGPG